MRCEVDLAAITTDTATTIPAPTKSIKSPWNGTLVKKAARPQLTSRSTPNHTTRLGRRGRTTAPSIKVEKMIGINEGVRCSPRANCCRRSTVNTATEATSKAAVARRAVAGDRIDFEAINPTPPAKASSTQAKVDRASYGRAVRT